MNETNYLEQDSKVKTANMYVHHHNTVLRQLGLHNPFSLW
jgi:hypothetical protein